ncbi:MAG: Holliday junction resolvase RuvX [Deltaproteobacteria bacterium]|nr:Holliday junction resolvase RuvX [Deltaproteobacteria bacterium]
MKILAIDPGKKRIGLAASDALHLTTRLLPVLEVSGLGESLRELAKLIAAEEFQKVVIGLPLNMDGSEGEAARAAKAMAERLRGELAAKGIACEVELWDERLTSFEAEQRTRQQGVAKAKAKAFLDSVAAEVLLEDYLASHPQESE